MGPIFHLLALMTLGGGVAAMMLGKPVHCALSLVIAFAGLAGIYLGLGAEFLGLAQVMVYIGAVAILIVFVMLLTRSGDEEPEPSAVDGWRWGVVVGVVVTAVLFAVVFMGPLPVVPDRLDPPPEVRDLGQKLMTDFVMPLQVVGVLLTAALIGAAILAMPRKP